jgi:phage baseplate assembly protein W
MNFYGSALSFPIRPDRRGTLATTSDPVEIVAQAIRDIIQTRPGERVMLPDYGVADLTFAVVDAAFKHTLEYKLEQQIFDYIPGVESLDVTVDISDGSRVEVIVNFSVLGSNKPGNLVFPIWQLRKDVSASVGV